jgi:hypothetical protein
MLLCRLAVLAAAGLAPACGEDVGASAAPGDARSDAWALDGANRGLGMPCLNEASCLGTSAPACVSADSDPQDDGFCSLECGVFGHDTLTQDDSACRAAYTGTVGVPVCVLADGDPPTHYYCGILCGPNPETAVDDGPCPGGLACKLSIDGVMDPGKELCSD